MEIYKIAIDRLMCETAHTSICLGIIVLHPLTERGEYWDYLENRIPPGWWEWKFWVGRN